MFFLDGVRLLGGELVDEFVVGERKVVEDGTLVVERSHDSIAADDVDACIGVCKR